MLSQDIVESTGALAPVPKQDKPVTRKVKRKGAAEAAPALPEGDTPDIEEVAQPRSRALVVVDHIEKDGEVFPGPNGNTYTTMRGVTMDLRDEHFDNYATNWARENLRCILSDTDLREVKRALSAAASTKPKKTVWKRCGPAPDGGMYLDLGQVGNSRCVEVFRDGRPWRIVPRPVGCEFIRPPAMLPLLDPQRGGSIGELWKFVNVAPPRRPLVLGWLLTAMCPWLECKWVLTFGGKSKAGKTSSTLCLRNLFDPSDADLLPPSKDPESFALDAEGALVLCFDNMQGVLDWLSNTICRASQGQAWTGRKRYSDRSRVVIRYTTPMIINGIEVLAEREDLINRSLIIELEALPQANRIGPAALKRKFLEASPQILGALLDALGAGMAGLDSESTGETITRDPAFDALMAAAEPAMGLQPGDFAKAYAAMAEANLEVGLTACPIYQYLAPWLEQQRANRGTSLRRTTPQAELDAEGAAIMSGAGFLPAPQVHPALLKKGPVELWSGTMTALLGILNGLKEEKFVPGWPPRENKLSGQLTRISEALEAKDGIKIVFSHGQERIVTFYAA